MNTERLKGGKADNASVKSIAKLHGAKEKDIEREIQIGMNIEKEHTSSKSKQREISKDHVIEDEEYYTNPKTGLIAKEKETRANKLNEEFKKMKALAGIIEGDKKFLKNESFSEPDSATLYPDRWKEMDGIFMGPNGITQEKLDAVTKMMENENQEISLNDANIDDWKGMDAMPMGISESPNLEEIESGSDFTVSVFDQIDVAPGEDDENLYKLG